MLRLREALLGSTGEAAAPNGMPRGPRPQPGGCVFKPTSRATGDGHLPNPCTHFSETQSGYV